jgi:hypothetical protein
MGKRGKNTGKNNGKRRWGVGVKVKTRDENKKVRQMTRTKGGIFKGSQWSFLR